MVAACCDPIGAGPLSAAAGEALPVVKRRGPDYHAPLKRASAAASDEERSGKEGRDAIMWHVTILHVTILLVVGFFVAYTAQKATGGLKTFGTFLSYWLYLLAVAVVVLGVVFGYYHGMGMMGYYGGGWMHDYSAPSPRSAPAPDAGGTSK